MSPQRVENWTTFSTFFYRPFLRPLRPHEWLFISCQCFQCQRTGNIARRQLNAGRCRKYKMRWCFGRSPESTSFNPTFLYKTSARHKTSPWVFFQCSIIGFSFKIFPCFWARPNIDIVFSTRFVIALYPTNYLPNFRPTMLICIDASLYFIGVPS